MGNDIQISSDAELRSAIEARNHIRGQAGLSAIDPDSELDRACQLQDRREFNLLMQSPIRYRAEQKLLGRIRRRTSNPDWKPTGMLAGGGWAFHTALTMQMRKLRDRLGR